MLTQHLTLGIALASSPGSQIFNYAWVDITQGPPLTQPHTPVKPDYTLSSTIRRIEKIGGAMECPNTTPGTEDKMEESSETHQDTAHDAKATSKVSVCMATAYSASYLVVPTFDILTCDDVLLPRAGSTGAIKF